MTIIFSGTIGRSGLGGQAWASLQYLLGLRNLGHSVYYLEDCGDTSYVWDWEREEWNYELDYPSRYVHECLAPFGLGDRWIYRTNAGSRGMTLEDFLEICRTADLLILRAVPLWVWRKEYGWPGRRAFIDVDPGFTQISIANGDRGIAEGVARCERRFTIAQRIGAAGCTIPMAGGPWIRTLPPVFLAEWPVVEEPAEYFTSVIRWQGFREVSYGGVSYGQRDTAFQRYVHLPHGTTQKFRLAVMGTDRNTLHDAGWETVPGEEVSRTPDRYQEFIRRSGAEFCIPKHGYVVSKGGWFSDRSVCYLATGRPVLMEDTGLSDWLPVGRGVIPFADPDSALAGIEAVNKDYATHSTSARRLAESFFGTETVLSSFLVQALN